MTSLDEALLHAIISDDAETVTALLEQGANPNATFEYAFYSFDSGSRKTALEIALHDCTHKELTPDVVSALLQHGANPNETGNPYAHPPLFSAILFSNLPLVELLLEHGADIHAPMRGVNLLTSAGVFSVDVTRLLLDRGMDIDATLPYFGYTALMMAVHSVLPEVVKLLLERGANVHIKDVKGQTALDRIKRTYRNEKHPLTQIRNMLIKAGAK